MASNEIEVKLKVGGNLLSLLEAINTALEQERKKIQRLMWCNWALVVLAAAVALVQAWCFVVHLMLDHFASAGLNLFLALFFLYVSICIKRTKPCLRRYFTSHSFASSSPGVGQVVLTLNPIPRPPTPGESSSSGSTHPPT